MATTKTHTNKNGSVSYEIRVSLGRDLNKKQKLKYKTWTPAPGMTARQVEKELERQKVLFEERCRKGQVLDTQTKFADFADIWLDRKAKEHSPAYQKRAVSLLERINAGIGHLKLSKIKPFHLQAFYSNLQEEGVKHSGDRATAADLYNVIKARGLSRAAVAAAAKVAPNTITVACKGIPVTIETAKKIAGAMGDDVHTLFTVENKKEALSAKSVLHHHRLISSILQSAVKWEVIFDNPARRVEPPKVPKKEAAYLDDKQALEVVNALAAAPLKWRTAVMLLVYSGMRRGEACGLVWDDIDFANALVHITKSNQYLSGKGTFEKETKNESSVRVIKLPPEMFALLREYKNWQIEERLKMGSKWQNTGKVFTQDNGLAMHPDSITGWVAKFRTANNLPYFSPHSLRHTSATLLILAGVPVKVVSARLGHANQNTTNAVYSHAIQTADAMASDVIGDIFSGGAAKAGG